MKTTCKQKFQVVYTFKIFLGNQIENFYSFLDPENFGNHRAAKEKEKKQTPAEPKQ